MNWNTTKSQPAPTTAATFLSLASALSLGMRSSGVMDAEAAPVALPRMAPAVRSTTTRFFPLLSPNAPALTDLYLRSATCEGRAGCRSSVGQYASEQNSTHCETCKHPSYVELWRLQPTEALGIIDRNKPAYHLAYTSLIYLSLTNGSNHKAPCEAASLACRLVQCVSSNRQSAHLHT